MTKKQKRIVMYLAAFLVALALVSVCLVGNTFARFVTGESGKANLTVANWTVSQETGSYLGSTAVNIGSLSPAETPSNAPTSNATHDSTPVAVSVIKIDDSTAVDVDLYISYSSLSYLQSDASTSVSLENNSLGDYTGTSGSYTTPSTADLNAVFTLTLYYKAATGDAPTATSVSDLTTAANGWTQVTSGDQIARIYTANNSTTYVSIYAYVTWTTLYTTYSNVAGTITGSTNYYVADELDSWIGANVAYVSSTVTATALQGSQIPA